MKVQLNVEIDARLKKRLVKRLVDEDRTVTEWVAEMATKYLEEGRAKK